MLIDCGTCEVRDVACDDCVVTVLLGPTQLEAGRPAYAPVLDAQERDALAVLAASGLIPPLRLTTVKPWTDDDGEQPIEHAM